jgi:hypothetical protein
MPCAKKNLSENRGSFPLRSFLNNPSWSLGLWLALACFCLASASGFGQSGASSSTGAPLEGKSAGGYLIHQSTEFGGRYTSVTGSESMYDTLVNLHNGPRLLEQTLSMRSETHEAPLFDNLYVSSFGWGGDPQNVLRARIDKNKWYDFRGSFRRDQNFFDYNLLANPLNPSTSSPTVPLPDSPHTYETRHRMTDLDLTLLPLSTISFRLGYSRNNTTGPSYNSFHEGTDVSLYQPWNTTMNSYRLGADWKISPRNMVSYDQFLDYYKGDTSWLLGSAVPAQLPGGAGPVELGLPIDTVSGFPCSVPTGSTSLIDPTGTLTNLSCNAYIDYSRFQRVRTSMPTERVRFHSNGISRLDLTASYAYSSAGTNTPLNEFFNGLVNRSQTRQYTITGPAKARRISNVGDVSANVHISDHFRLAETFYLWDYRIPQNSVFTETDWNIGTGNCAAPTCTILVPISGITPTTSVTTNDTSFNQSWRKNQLELIWDINKIMGARVGFRYGDRHYYRVNDFSSGDIDDVTTREYTALFGFWARPTPAMRFNFDYENANFDNVLFRLSPRKQRRYRGQAGYNPRPWAVLSGSINIVEDSNNDQLTAYQGHNRNYSIEASLAPRERFGVDLAYNYNDYQQNALICFNDAPPTGVTLPFVTTAGACADSNNPLLNTGYYTNGTHFGSAILMFKPIKRVTTRVGYSIVSVNGSTPQFNILQPPGDLQYQYQQPVGNIAVEIVPSVTLNAGWNYYQYGETSSFVGPTAPRYFHANIGTFSLRYEF